MLRQEAVNVIKEINTFCKQFSPKAINLISSGVAGHYEIQIDDGVEGEDWSFLNGIVKKHGLGIRFADKTFIIYKNRK